jgi:hypothetical protein
MPEAVEDEPLSRPGMVLLLAAVAVPPLALAWTGIGGGSPSTPVLLGGVVVPLGALAVGGVAIAVREDGRRRRRTAAARSGDDDRDAAGAGGGGTAGD